MDGRHHLRHVAMDVATGRYELRTWETDLRSPTGQIRLGYVLTAPDGTIVFSGDDYGCSPMDAIDSDDALRGLLGFLTLKPGDTDDEYFAHYTDRQRAFCEGDAEELSMWALEPDDASEEEFAFVNLDGWPDE